MPIYPDAEAIIKTNLALIEAGQRAPVRQIGRLTDVQHHQINCVRVSLNLPPLADPEVVYMGRHHYNSRSKDGYLIHDMWLQIEAALHASAMVNITSRLTSLQATVCRHDGYGNVVYDMAILELTQRKPRAELFSAIPKGDENKPGSKKAPSAETEGALCGDPG
ncbi:MAG: hypothetical protein H7Y60_12050 [Rhodospirillaceae bacterium]|nr:hypothetical protein [Rhodospirillales bacterium]